MATVTSIREYRARTVRATLEELIRLNETGEMTGLAFACKMGDFQHGIGLAGDYLDDPLQVLSVTARINHRVNQMLDGAAVPESTFSAL